KPTPPEHMVDFSKQMKKHEGKESTGKQITEHAVKAAFLDDVESKTHEQLEEMLEQNEGRRVVLPEYGKCMWCMEGKYCVSGLTDDTTSDSDCDEFSTFSEAYEAITGEAASETGHVILDREEEPMVSSPEEPVEEGQKLVRSRDQIIAEHIEK